MKVRKVTSVVLVNMILLFMLSSKTLAVVINLTYSDGLTTGLWSGPPSATTTQAYSLTTSYVTCPDGDKCYYAVIANPYAFSYKETITLPKVGEIYKNKDDEIGLFDQTFHDTTKTHEDWHAAYAGALLNSTYGKLENWSAGYSSNLFNTEAEALAAGNADLTKALNTAINAFQADYNTDVTGPYGHETATAEIKTVDGVDTWRSNNPDWGQGAVNYANKISVTFTKTAGNCACVPEPSTVMLFAIGLIGLLIHGIYRKYEYPRL